MFRVASLLVSFGLLTGCSTYAASRYSINADNVVALRQLSGKTVGVGQFTSTQPPQSEVVCRAVGPIKTPDGESYSDFIRKALVDELKIAAIYSDNAPVMLTGNLNSIDVTTFTGGWSLSLTVNSSNGRSLTESENYKFTSSYFGETACNQTAQAFMPAVQNLIGRVVRNPAFRSLIET